MASKDFILADLIRDVVDTMRETNTITSSSEDNSVYSVESNNNLSDNDSIVIESVSYIVSNVSESSFKIEGETGIDFTGKSWKALAPYYEHGHIVEIGNILKEKDKSRIYKYQKYPLIVLVQDYKGSKSTDNSAIFGQINARILFLTLTKSEIKSSERYDLNFRNILFPLYDDFIYAAVNIGYFDTLSIPPYISHDWYERPYWGASINPENSNNILDDYIDAIELDNVELKIINGIQNC